MNESKHAEYKRIVKGARIAVLCVHGILGTPNHFRDLVPLIPKKYSVFNIVLDGHCAGVDDFSHASMKKWEKNVSDALCELLSTHDEVYILAHSMGTLLAIEAAMREKRITKLFCLSIPIKVGFKLRMLTTMLKMYFGRVSESDTYAYAATECTGMMLSANPFKYIGFVPRYIELFVKIHQVRKMLPNLSTPCVSYQSSLDELVSARSYTILQKESSIRTEMLEHSTHFYYEAGDLERIQDDFLNFLDN